MSDPIKPPDGPSGPDAPTAQPDAVEGAPGEFKAAVDAAAGPGAAADAVRAGTLDPSQAVEGLVQRALATARGLPEAQRQKLEAQLRAALAEDPTLLALQEDLQRATET